MAAYLQANPEGAKNHGLTSATLEKQVDKRIQEYVSSFYSAAWGELAADPAREDAARLCALGNPAACEH